MDQRIWYSNFQLIQSCQENGWSFWIEWIMRSVNIQWSVQITLKKDLSSDKKKWNLIIPWIQSHPSIHPSRLHAIKSSTSTTWAQKASYHKDISTRWNTVLSIKIWYQLFFWCSQLHQTVWGIQGLSSVHFFRQYYKLPGCDMFWNSNS